MKPHSRAWYAHLAAETGRYEYPWTQVLSASSGETLFDTLLEELLTSESHVLEAGCGHGWDARRYAHRVRSYTGYDFTPAYVARARRNAPQAEFVLWDSSLYRKASRGVLIWWFRGAGLPASFCTCRSYALPERASSAFTPTTEVWRRASRRV